MASFLEMAEKSAMTYSNVSESVLHYTMLQQAGRPWYDNFDIGKVLNDAADYIDKHGWGQRHDQHPITGHVCARGAIGAALGCSWKLGTLFNDPFEITRVPVFDKPVEYARAFFRVLYVLLDHLHEADVARWNDAPGRTKEEVTAALRGAAAVWRAKNRGITPQRAPERECASVPA